MKLRCVETGRTTRINYEGNTMRTSKRELARDAQRIRDAIKRQQEGEARRQRYVQEITKAIDSALARMFRGDENAFYLYFKRHGLEFRAFSEMDDTTGFELVTGERISGFKTREQLLAWARPLCDRCPVLPVKV